ncbi:hypothetical protein KI688_004443 [Linnemannia hyalina]|uniref:HCP-like protein n=1 Tax=Linnemannia hyalina TaxID=64524 RepID=A0A9P7XN51_9FUNG|nr:hypothetical protein KI688_004443 [Linnemannia hyalina]
MLQEDYPQVSVRAIRSIDKSVPPNAIPPATPDEIYHVDTHPDPETQMEIVLWDDILQGFKYAEHVRHKTRVRQLELQPVPPQDDSTIKVNAASQDAISIPSATSMPITTTATSTPNSISSSSAPPTATSAVRWNPVYGLVETAMENYTHIDRSIVFPSARGPQAVLDDRTPVVKDSPTTPHLDNNRPQLQGPQFATTNLPMEMDVTQTSISASPGGILPRPRSATNYQAAMDWYLKAAQQGHASAHYNIGVLYNNGQGVPQDYAQAMEWYLKAADQGYANAQYNISSCYERGQGVPQDYAQAMEWYLKAADQGYANAQYNIGSCYERGQGVPQDYAQAMEWYLKAAQQRNASAQFSIGVLYDNGQGAPLDYTKTAV